MIRIVETEKEFEKTIGPVAAKFDLYAEDKKNRIIVEIQRVRRADHYDRFLYYHCTALMEQAIQFGDYRPGRRIFTIVVLTSGDKHKRDVTITDFAPRDLQGQSIKELRHKIVFLCPKYVSDQTPPPYREWLAAINDSLDGEVEEGKYQEPAILQVLESILADTITPHERARLKDEYSDELLIQDKIKQKQLEVARRMLERGLEMALITQLTDLSEAEINAPQDEE